MFDFGSSQSAIQALARENSANATRRNEATTRLQLIDRIFFESLGWSPTDVTVDEPHGGEYADYTFQHPRRVLILETKKEGEYFQLPSGSFGIEQSIPTIMRNDLLLNAALEQTARYCNERGVPFGAVCNGHQIVAFVATRTDGIPPLDGRALVFDSIDSMAANFFHLWQALSKPGIADKNLAFRLIGSSSLSVPGKLSSIIPQYPGVRNRNIFQIDLQILSDLVIEDLARNPDLEPLFLEECYSRSGALSQYATISKDILEARYAALFNTDSPGPITVPAVDKKGISAELLADSFSRRPLLLIGDVGVGKTIFIRNLIKRDASAEFARAITLYIDLGSQGTLALDIRRYVLDEIVRQLREEHGTDVEERNFVHGVYFGELQRFSRGIEGDLKQLNPALYREREVEFLRQKMDDLSEHLQHCLEHISKGRKKQIVLVIDNADQRDDPDQDQAFLIAQEFAERWPATVLVALRPETFHRSIQRGALSGYHPRAFTIAPPRIDDVIERRLRFAKRLTDGDLPIEGLEHRHTQAKLLTLGKIIDIFLASLTRNRDLVEFIDNMAGGNVRFALDLVRGFFGSGHVNTEKIVRTFEDTGSYFVPLHEFLRAVIYGDGEYYDPSRSPIANLFDISTVDPKEHFLLPLMLSAVSSLGEAGGSKGFAETAVIYERLQGLGFTPDQVDASLVRAHQKRLVESSARQTPRVRQPMPESIRATTVGVYHLRELCRSFAYLDAVVVDTPILLTPFRSAILKDAREIQPRLNRAHVFRKYLDQQWEGVARTEVDFDWAAVSADLGRDIRNASEKESERRKSKMNVT